MTVVLSTETETHDAVVPRRRSRDELRPPPAACKRPPVRKPRPPIHVPLRMRRAPPSRSSLRPTPRDAHPTRRSLYADGRVGRTESRGMGRPVYAARQEVLDRPERDRRSGRGALHAGRRRRRAGLRPRIRYAVDRHGRLRRRSARLHDHREPHGLVRSRDGADADPDRRRNRGRGNARVVHATLHGRAGRTTLPLHRQRANRSRRPTSNGSATTPPSATKPTTNSKRRSSSPPQPASAPSPWRSSPKRC